MAECQFTVRFRQENPSVGSLADVLWAIDTVYYLFLALKFEPQERNSAVNSLTLPFPRLEFLQSRQNLVGKDLLEIATITTVTGSMQVVVKANYPEARKNVREQTQKFLEEIRRVRQEINGKTPEDKLKIARGDQGILDAFIRPLSEVTDGLGVRRARAEETMDRCLRILTDDVLEDVQVE